LVENKIDEAFKKLKEPLDIGKGKKGYYYLEKVGYDANGNWSYMVARGANKPKKIQHQGDWGTKFTKDDKEISQELAKKIIDYYEEYIN